MLLVWMRQCGGCRISRLSGFPQFNRVELESGELELDAAVNGLNLAQQTGLVASQTMEARTERSGIGSRSIGYQVFCCFTSFYYRNSCSQPTTRLTHTHTTYIHSGPAILTLRRTIRRRRRGLASAASVDDSGRPDACDGITC